VVDLGSAPAPLTHFSTTPSGLPAGPADQGQRLSVSPAQKVIQNLISTVGDNDEGLAAVRRIH
jgi:hypothetical protein